MAWTFDPDATYDLYRLADDGERDPFPYYRIAERHFYKAIIAFQMAPSERLLGRWC